MEEKSSYDKTFESLKTLALDLIWSWNHKADNVWQRLDPILWDLTRNPWIVLQTVSKDKLEKAIADPSFCKMVQELLAFRKQELESSTWFKGKYSDSSLSGIAYFSMEFMLSEALPIYSGGLGNVAGDQLKAASDLGIPVSAVGLLYQRGYYRQLIDKIGKQQVLYPYNDPGQLPITPLRRPNGEWLRIEIALPGWSVWLRTWQANVGRVKLYLLDSNDAANFSPHRGITSELYGGDSELRLKQELVLGIGGWRLLTELGISPQVCHLNEGHAAFAVLERAKSFMKETGQPFEVALEAMRSGNLFTTHTAVPAGFDRFSPSLIEQYLGNYAKNQLGINLQDLLALGRENPEDASEYFNMAYLAVRGSGAVNAVSRLHCQVSKAIFEPLFRRWPKEEIPIGYVTNGVHMPSWDSAAADDFWTEMCGKCRWEESAETLKKRILQAPAERIWKMRNDGRKTLVEFIRKTITRLWAARGSPQEDVERAKQLFDPNVLTLGFARRFATYKRPNMLLHDPERLLRILTNKDRPVQLVLAGKAHPADRPGQELIEEWIRFIRRPEARSHIIFMSDYDMLLTEQLVGGVDVWINTPRRPWEACGTSGMKVLVNGGLNLSELDGWWVEAYTPEMGWALGDGNEHGDDPAWDAMEANNLYEILEQQVIPDFYKRDKDNIPTTWIDKIRQSMAYLTPQYSAHRAVRQYTEQYYLPAASALKTHTGDKGIWAQEVVQWRHSLEKNWPSLCFGPFKISTVNKQHTFEIPLFIKDLDPNTLKVELFANGSDGTPEIHEMHRVEKMDAPHTFLYRIVISSTLPANYYTPRVVPFNNDVEIPLEAAQILWQH
jgi:starch phosphorylase